MKLYGSPNPKSVNTLKIRVALAEADATYDFVPVDLGKGQNRTPEFLALNPHGKIPVLTDGDFVLPESGAILWYVAERFPAARLLGTSAQARARAHEWCDFMATGGYAAFSDVSMHTGVLPPERRVPAVVDLAEQRLSRCLDVMEHVLGTRAYFADEYSIADIANAALVNALRDRVPHVLGARSRPHLEGWFARVASRPAWGRALG
jgi:glutathione S-transferase